MGKGSFKTQSKGNADRTGAAAALLLTCKTVAQDGSDHLELVDYHNQQVVNSSLGRVTGPVASQLSILVLSLDTTFLFFCSPDRL